MAELDIISDDNKKFLKARAEYGDLPKIMDIYQIAYLTYPETPRYEAALIASLKQAMRRGELPLPPIKDYAKRLIPLEMRMLLPIPKDNYKQFLTNLGEWPVGEKVLISNWWLDESQEALGKSESDAALGRDVRNRQKKFAKRWAEEYSAGRHKEWGKWRVKGKEIQEKRQRPASKRELAELVKRELKLPDSPDTIRKRL